MNTPRRATGTVVVVGVGADGWAGLDTARRAAVEAADVLLGGERHLALVPNDVTATRVPWPSPLREGLSALLEEKSADERAAATQTLAKRVKEADELAQAIFGDKNGVFQQMRSLGVAFSVALALRAFAVEPFQIPSGSMIPTLLIGDHLFVARCMYGLSVPFAQEPTYFARWSTPRPGDVVVFVAPPYVQANAGQAWIKRVIAGPGQRVHIKDGVVHVDDIPYVHVGDGADLSYDDFDEFRRAWSIESAAHQRERIPDYKGGDREHSILLTPDKAIETWPHAGLGGRPMRYNGLTCDLDSCTVDDGHIFVMGDNRGHSSDGRVWGAVPIDNVRGRALFIWMSVDGSERSVDLGRFTLPRFRWERLFQGIE